MNYSNIDDFLQSNNPLEDEYFIDLLHSQADRELMCKIYILDWKERNIGEIQGLVTDGSVNIDAGSSVRRTCNLSMVATESSIDISNMDNLIALNKKIRLYIGIKNSIPGYQEKYGDVIWFPMGVFVLTNGSIRHDISTNSLSITAQDKMCLLNGEVAGVLAAPTDFASYNQQTEDGKYITIYNTLFDIIRTAVIDLGSEDPGKVIILDLPDQVKTSMAYSNIGNKTFYINTQTGQSTESLSTANGWNVEYEVISKENPVVGYEMIDFTVPSKELLKQAGDTVTSVLDELIKILGNYEYYYDIDGNFIFREIRNYLNTTNKPYSQLDNGDYLANFDSNSVFYSFVGKQNISSYSNTPDWLNIKNDFIVWGTKEVSSSAKIPIYYRVAIDELPFYAEDTNIPWQQQLLDFEEQLSGTGLKHGPYYQELKAKWPLTYKEGKWDDNPSYFLDFIDVNSEIGKFSVNNIGRRTKVVVDENVKRMYPLYSPDLIIANTDEQVNDCKLRGVPFVDVRETGNGVIKYKNLTGTNTEKDAFNVVRELLFMHSTMNEVINISCLPLYNFEANVKIEVEDPRSDISGYYMIRSLNIPLSIEGQMSISAIRANSRI